MLSGIPFFEKNGIWRSNFSFVGDSSLFHTLKIRKCVTLDINFLPIDPNILSLNVSITFCLSFGVLIHKICGSSSFLIFFNPQNLQKQFFPLYFSQSTGRECPPSSVTSKKLISETIPPKKICNPHLKYCSRIGYKQNL